MKEEIKEKTIIELKALLFDIEQEIKRLQNSYNQVIVVLQEKIKKEEDLKND